jgi:ABC-type molybdate transport system substrate-binding protein
MSEGNQQRLSGTIQTQGKIQFRPVQRLARQIDEGVPVDIFFSADLLQMDNLEKKGREPKTRKNLLSNQLVIIVPGDSKLALPHSRIQSNLLPFSDNLSR